ncbi:MAG: pathogenicity locus [Deltaproteobacteria bacterium]|nr:pathogenicity locus [Deltaproteobacteria bacterium]
MSKAHTRMDDLQGIPGIGPRMTRGLRDLGFHRVEDLRNQDPERMYKDLCELRGTHIDRCVLYVFRCAVYYVSNARHEPELLKWGSWKDKKRSAS